MAVVTVLWAMCRLQPGFRRGIAVRRRSSVSCSCTASGRDPNADYAGTIPQQTFMVYQLMFAIITPALITRRLRGAHEVQRDAAVHAFCGRCSSTSRWRTWSGARAGC